MKPTALNFYCGIWEDGWAEALMAAGWAVINVGIEIADDHRIPGAVLKADMRPVAKNPDHYFPALDVGLIVASPPCQEFSRASQPFKKSREHARLHPPSTELFNLAFAARASLQKACGHSIPLVVENVMGAVPYVGQPSYRYGSFYLWSDVPPFMPPTAKYGHDGKSIGRKGFTRIKPEFGGHKYNGQGNGNGSRDGKEWRGNCQANRFDSKQDEGRKELARRRKRENCHASGERGKQTFAGDYERGAIKKLRIDPRTGKPYSGLGNDPSNGMSSHGSARKRWSAQAAKIPFELAYWIGQYYLPKEVKK